MTFLPWGGPEQSSPAFSKSARQHGRARVIPAIYDACPITRRRPFSEREGLAGMRRERGPRRGAKARVRRGGSNEPVVQCPKARIHLRKVLRPCPHLRRRAGLHRSRPRCRRKESVRRTARLSRGASRTHLEPHPRGRNPARRPFRCTRRTPPRFVRLRSAAARGSRTAGCGVRIAIGRNAVLSAEHRVHPVEAVAPLRCEADPPRLGGHR